MKVARTKSKKISNAQQSSGAKGELDEGWPKLKPGDKVLVKMQWSVAVDPNSSGVNAAIEIIGPTPEMNTHCRRDIAESIRFIRGTSYKIGLSKVLLRQLRQTTLKMSRLIGKLSPQSREHLLPFFEDQMVEIVQDGYPVLVPLDRTTPLVRLEGNLQVLAANLDRFLLMKKTRADNTKRSVAEKAYDLLVSYGHSKPTLTEGGAFFCLASCLYEAITGAELITLDRQCRAALKRRLTCTK